MGLYHDRMRDVVLNTSHARRVLAGERNHCNSGHGPFDHMLPAVCYCVCHAAMHYESYMRALKMKFRTCRDLPSSPLIVDLGCGPATTALALADWLRECGRQRPAVSFIGIDNSRPFREIALDMLSGANVFDDTSIFIVLPSVEQLTQSEIKRAVRDRNGVIFALSYILHQRFMQNISILASLMSRIRSETEGLPTWFLLQDANYQDTYGTVTEVWPETQVNALANRCRPIGYQIRGYGAKTIFRSPHVTIDRDGKFAVQEAGATSNVCHFFQRIA